MGGLRCQVCGEKLPLDGGRPTRRHCAACRAVMERLAEIHADDHACRPEVVGHADRVTRYAGIVEEGGRLFE